MQYTPFSLQVITGRMSSRLPTAYVTLPMRPPLCRYSSVSTQKNTFVLSTMRSLSRRRSSSVAPSASLRATASATKPAPMPMFIVSTMQQSSSGIPTVIDRMSSHVADRPLEIVTMTACS